MITRDPDQFLGTFRATASREGRATLRAALLVTPHGFEVSEESARDNRYMRAGTPVDGERARAQHRTLVQAVVDLDIPVVLFRGREGLPDGIYPNNVFATTPGRFIVGSMLHPGRRQEARRRDIRSFLSGTLGYELRDLSELDCIAELTGPLVIDRRRGVGLCGFSGRVDRAGCDAMHGAFELALTFCFDLHPSEYHTNIVLAVLAGRACVIHPPSFADPDVPRAIAAAYGASTVTLSDEEKEHFAGNCIAVSDHHVLISETAFRSLRRETLAAFQTLDFQLHPVAVDELEKGGGSLRCLIAEIF